MQRIVSITQKVKWLLAPLTGILTVLALFAKYAYRISWHQLITPLSLTFAVGIIWWVIFFIPKVTRHNAPLISTVATVITMIWGVFSPDFFMLYPVMVIILAVFAGVMMKEQKTLNTFVMVIVCVAIVASLGQSAIGTLTGGDKVIANTPDVVLREHTNVYFILPDKMSSHASLLESGYDNSAFIKELRGRGFYVNENAMSNDQQKITDQKLPTSRTPRYVASLLNLGVDVPLDSSYKQVFSMIQYNKVGVIFRANGYTFYNIGSWYPETQVNATANYNYISKSSSLLPTEELTNAVINRSLLLGVSQLIMMFDFNQSCREQQTYQFETLSALAQSKTSPAFIFMHLLLPHPPYVWTADGLPQEDKSLTQPQAKIEQTKYAEGYLIRLIDNIQSVDPTAIIIVQSDEGDNYIDNSFDKYLSNVQWEGVLSAWFIPGDDYSTLGSVKHTDILKYVIGELSR